MRLSLRKRCSGSSGRLWLYGRRDLGRGSAQDDGCHREAVAADPSWQAREGTGYDQSAFTIDWEAHIATCPHGKRSRWQPDLDVAGQEVIQIRFAKGLPGVSRAFGLYAC